jgi:RNA polymerase sigma-70 factor (ECF subfamily)
LAPPSDSSDRADLGDLASRIRGGDVAAFEQLFRLSYPSLCAFAHRYLDDAARAEELVQDLFTELWARRERWEVRGNPRAYLFSAVRNRALNTRKRDRVERDWAADEANADVRALHPMPASPAELLDAAETAAAIDAAMESLPERCRLVMTLRWREQLSHAEIADVMGISTKGVEHQLARGLRTLRRLLGTRR